MQMSSMRNILTGHSRAILECARKKHHKLQHGSGLVSKVVHEYVETRG